MLIIGWLFSIPLENILLTWRGNHFKTQAYYRHLKSLRAERDFYRATPALTKGLGVCGPV